MAPALIWAIRTIAGEWLEPALIAQGVVTLAGRWGAEWPINISATAKRTAATARQAAAASAGAAGAWNDINVLEGTAAYGALSAGDVVYIRCWKRCWRGDYAHADLPHGGPQQRQPGRIQSPWILDDGYRYGQGQTAF